LTGFAILIGFALPPLLRLKRVSPLRVLRRELDPINSSSWFVYGLALLLVAGLVVQYTGDMRLMITIIGGGLVAIVLSGGLIFTVLKQLNIVLPHLSLGSRLGFKGLLSNPTLTTVQIMAFSITLVAMLLSFTVRSDLLSDWQKQLPNDAPNYFALNLFPNQIASFEQQLKHYDIPAANIYPVVRGRLVEINGEPVQRHVTKDSQGERAVHRDLSLTWGNVLPADNKTLAGSWGQAKKGEVSIESKLAKSLKVVIGDKLTFTIGDEQVQAVVSHIRSVQWDTMKPNFYMVMSKETLDGFPTTYITSFFLSEANKKHLNALVKQFPAMTVLEVDAMLKQIKMILSQLTAAINYLLYFALLAGFTVLFSSVYSTLDNRISEGALMRTLGANRALLRKAQVVEFSMIGLITGVIAVLMSQLVLFGLYNYVLHLDFKLDVVLCLVVPVLSMLMVVMAGLWGVKDVVKKSPMVVLRES
jgi:putative ABC transport system permease protein